MVHECRAPFAAFLRACCSAGPGPGRVSTQGDLTIAFTAFLKGWPFVERLTADYAAHPHLISRAVLRPLIDELAAESGGGIGGVSVAPSHRYWDDCEYTMPWALGGGKYHVGDDRTLISGLGLYRVLNWKAVPGLRVPADLVAATLAPLLAEIDELQLACGHPAEPRSLDGLFAGGRTSVADVQFIDSILEIRATLRRLCQWQWRRAVAAAGDDTVTAVGVPLLEL